MIPRLYLADVLRYGAAFGIVVTLLAVWVS